MKRPRERPFFVSHDDMNLFPLREGDDVSLKATLAISRHCLLKKKHQTLQEDLPVTVRLVSSCAPVALFGFGLLLVAPQIAAADNVPATAGGQTKAGQDAQKKLEDEDPTKIVKKADPGSFKEGPDAPVEQQANGMWVDKDGNPTPYVSKDNEVGWFVASGFRRYGANCLQCHGPDAMGSSYAPALVDSLKTMSYATFLQTVAGGKKDVSNSSNLVMPAFGDNKNVQCYINDIYVYVRARALGLQPRGEPGKHASKPAIYGTQETACLGF